MAKFCAECGTELVRNNVCDKCKKAYLFENAGSTKICPICGFDAVYQGKCMNCNNIIDEQADWHKSTGTDNYGAPATGGRQGNRFCKNCGTPVDGAGSFCTGCGMNDVWRRFFIIDDDTFVFYDKAMGAFRKVSKNR